MSTSLFQKCSAQYDNRDSIAECISDSFEARTELQRQDVYNWFLIIAGAMIFLMQVGFAMLCAGCVRKRNVINTMLKVGYPC